MIEEHRCFLITCSNITKNKKYCSLSCAGKVSGKIAGKIAAQVNREKQTGIFAFTKKQRSDYGKIGGHNSQKILKEKDKGFYNSNIQRELGKRVKTETHIKAGRIGGKIGGKITGQICKELKVGVCGMTKEENAKAGRKGIKSQMQNSLGIFNEEGRRLACAKAAETNRRNKTGLCNPEIQAIGASLGGKKGSEVLRQNYGYPFKNILFDSMMEREFGVGLWYQFENLVTRKNFQISVGNLTYDFLIEKYKCFIEFHPFNPLYDTEEGYKNWMKERRNNLNKFGYKSYNLIFIN